MSPVVEHQHVAEVNTQPGRASDYSAYVPVHLERVKTAAYVDSGNTLAKVISPQTMAAMGITEGRLEPVPQPFVGTAAAGKAMRVLGQAPRVELTFGSHPAKFCIRPLVLQGLVHPLNLRGAFLAHCGIDRLHSKGALQIQGKEVLMYHPRARWLLPHSRPGHNVCTLEIPAPAPQLPVPYPGGPDHQMETSAAGAPVGSHTRQVVRLQVQPPLTEGTQVTCRPSSDSGLGPHNVLQTAGSSNTIPVLWDNLQTKPLRWEPKIIPSALHVAPSSPEIPSKPEKKTSTPFTEPRPSTSAVTGHYLKEEGLHNDNSEDPTPVATNMGTSADRFGTSTPIIRREGTIPSSTEDDNPTRTAPRVTGFQPELPRHRPHPSLTDSGKDRPFSEVHQPLRYCRRKHLPASTVALLSVIWCLWASTRVSGSLLHNARGRVEPRHTLTAYDCADPAEVLAFSSHPEQPCEARQTPVHPWKEAQYQLLQREKRRYITGFSCTLERTIISYNCGSLDHPELDPKQWVFGMPKKVPAGMCREWIRTRQYKPTQTSSRMYSQQEPPVSLPLRLNEPGQVSYIAYGHTFVKYGLPTDTTYQVGCNGEPIEVYKGFPMARVVSYSDKVLLKEVKLTVEGRDVIDQAKQTRLPCTWLNGGCRAEGTTYVWNITDPGYCHLAVVKKFTGRRLVANTSITLSPDDSLQVQAIVSTDGVEKIRLRDEGPSSQCHRVVIQTNLKDVYLYPLLETNQDGRVLQDNRDSLFERKIHPSEVDLEKYIANRDDFLYHDLTVQAEKEFDAILHQDCLRRQDEARKAHFFEQGMPGYQPFLLQDGTFSTRSGEANYRYRCRPRTVHPVSTKHCFNKLPVVLRPPVSRVKQVVNFTDSPTYFMEPDARLLSSVASEIPCTALFPATYKTHQGWIVVTPEVHPAPEPLPLPAQAPHREDDVFEERDYNQGGLYESGTLSVLQDFLRAPLLREAVTYKLAYQVHNLQPENQHVLTPTDIFPYDAVGAADWRKLIFGGWWGWLEDWGQWVSVCLGMYYLYVIIKTLVTACFSVGVLYQEHGLSPSLLWGLGVGQSAFPMRFYRRWREFQRNTRNNNRLPNPPRFAALQAPQPLPRPPPANHEYLMIQSETTTTAVPTTSPVYSEIGCRTLRDPPVTTSEVVGTEPAETPPTPTVPTNETSPSAVRTATVPIDETPPSALGTRPSVGLDASRNWPTGPLGDVVLPAARRS